MILGDARFLLEQYDSALAGWPSVFFFARFPSCPEVPYCQYGGRSPILQGAHSEAITIETEEETDLIVDILKLEAVES